MREIDIVFIGHTVKETNIGLDNTIKSTLGGGGLSPAIAASTVILPERIGLISRIGTDDFGNHAQSYIKKKGYDIEGLDVVSGGQTTWVVIQEMPIGRRIAVDLGVSNDFVFNVPSSYKNAQYVHIGSGPSIQQLEWLKEIKNEFSSTTIISADPLEVFIRSHPQETRALLEKVDLIFINEEEWELISQYGELITKAPMVLKRGDKGVVYISGDKRITVPAPKVTVVHTAGAGETVAGVFLGLRVQKVPIPQALAKAVEYASVSVTQYGIEHLNASIQKHNAIKDKRVL